MSVSRQIEENIVSRLEGAGKIRAKRMFGGVGLYLDGFFCGIIGGDSERLYLKVDDTNRGDYEREGMERFRTPRGTLSYYMVPTHVVEKSQLLREWVLKARAAAAKRNQGQ